MTVQCPYCKFVFNIKENEVNFCIGSKTPFVRCRNPKIYGKSMGKTFYCDGFIDLTYAFGHDVPSSTSALDANQQN